MNKNKGRNSAKKIQVIKYDQSKPLSQLSIRSFFSTQHRKSTCTPTFTKTPDKSTPESSPDFIETTPLTNGKKRSRSILSCSLVNGVEHPPKKKLSYSPQLVPKKYELSNSETADITMVSQDALEELENSSPEELSVFHLIPSKLKTSVSHRKGGNKTAMKLGGTGTELGVRKNTTYIEEMEGKLETNAIDRVMKNVETPERREEISCNEELVNGKIGNDHVKCSEDNKVNGLIDIEDVGDLFDGDWDDDFSFDRLYLNDWKYCKVLSVEFCKEGTVLTLAEFSKGKITSESAVCVLTGCWASCAVKRDDIIRVKASYDASSNRWLLDNKQGFLIKHPDLLITGTGIVDSLFCPRRSVLGYLFPGGDPANMSMVIGSLVHELLQEILRNKLYLAKQMESVVQELVKSRRTLFLAYECDVPLTTIETELKQFLPRISTFIRTYIVGSEYSKKNWSGHIVEILSIEQNFWVPNLGIKGKADLIVKVQIDGVEKVLPLELKTGRATNSSEHRGQIILYSMMMTELGMDVNSGLLLYLKENVLSEIRPQHPERSGLINIRNNLVDYFMENETLPLSSENTFQLPNLPEPINHHSGCAKCPYLTVCSASMSEQHRANLSERNPLRMLSVQSVKHLSPAHIRYIFHWLGLLKMEELTRKNSQNCDISDLWHMDVNKRERRGYCVGKLSLIGGIEPSGNRYIHHMTRSVNDNFDFTTSGLVEGDYIVISSGSRYAIATGFVHDISESKISCKLDRCLQKAEKITYSVDKYSMYDSLLGFNTSSLLLLMEDTNPSNRLRSFIIDMEIPKFHPIQGNVKLSEYECLLQTLNDSQRKAILKVLETQDYMLIKGMPGTGKTATIVTLVKILAHLKYTVLITSHTHSAVDNILLRLKGDVDFLRIGSSVRVHPALKTYSEDAVLESRTFSTIADLEAFYNSKQIVAVTCMGCSHALFRKRNFDFCIVDEATQVLQPSVVKALFASKRFILIGDPEQLPPVVQSKEASHLGLGESLFKRLDRPEVTSVLNLQYRMNNEIMKLANLFVYENALQCANDQIRTATVQLKNAPSTVTTRSQWLQRSLSVRLSDSVLLLNTNELITEFTSDYSNKVEIDITFTIVDALLQDCDSECDIGIIAPFREQVELLRKTASMKNCNIEINTIDQYQGRDKDVIIYSCTKSLSTKDIGILSDKRRLTVAITRAKRKLIIVGNVPVLETYSVFRDLFALIPQDNKINVKSI